MKRLIIGAGKYRYEWIDRWAVIPDTSTGRENGRTHGVVVSDSGAVFVFHQANPAVLKFDPGGKLIDAWGTRFLGAHGMTLVKEKNVEYLWLTDQYSGEVVKTTLDGRVVQSLEKPGLEIYQHGKYSPTWVAVNETRFGGSGDVWVADGYGMSVVHRFDAAGGYVQTIDGSEGKAGRFNCPHAVTFDLRSGKPELLIADRGNKQFQVYGADGTFRRSFGREVLSCPCMAITVGDELFVPELDAKLTILDSRNKVVGVLGENTEVCGIEGWPNHHADLIEPGKFNSPHSMAVDPEGNLYVVEWIIGGRITKLARQIV